MTSTDGNPFADSQDVNPFADPYAPTQASTSAVVNRPMDGELDGYNPFEKDKDAGKLPSKPKPALSQPAVAEMTAVPPPSYSLSAAQQNQYNIDTAELRRRQEELERKAQELELRENQLREQSATVEKTNNFPPIPSCIPIKPCFYQDIDAEIPLEFNRLVRIGYYLWITHALLYVFNFIFAIGYLVTSGSNLAMPAATTMGLSVLWLIAFLPLSFVCWFRPLYKAFRSDSSINFFTFFLVCGIQIIVDFVAFLGTPSGGFIGILTAVPLSKQGGAATNMSYLMWIITAVFAVVLAADVLLLIRVHRLYRSNSTASFQKAQSEFTTGVFTNPAVRQAGAQLAADAATSTFNGPTSGYGTSAGAST